MLSIATMPSQRFVNGGKRQDLRSRWVRRKNSSHSSVIRKGGKSARRKGPNYIGCGKSIMIQYHLERLAQPNELGWPCLEFVKHLTCQSRSPSATGWRRRRCRWQLIQMLSLRYV